MRNSKRYLIYSTVLLLILVMQSCDLVVDIFSAGFWVGIVLAVLVLALIIWLVVKGLKKMR